MEPSKLASYKWPLRIFAISLPIILLIPPIVGSNLGYDLVNQTGTCLLRNGEDESYFWACFACPAALLVIFVIVTLVQMIIRISTVANATAKHTIIESSSRNLSEGELSPRSESETSPRPPRLSMSNDGKQLLKTFAKIFEYSRRPMIFLCSFCTTIIFILGFYSYVRSQEIVLYEGLQRFTECILTEFSSFVLANGGRKYFLDDYISQIERYDETGVAPSATFDYGSVCGDHASPRPSPSILLAMSVFLSITGVIPYLVYSRTNYGIVDALSSTSNRLTKVKSSASEVKNSQVESRMDSSPDRSVLRSSSIVVSSEIKEGSI